MRSSLPEKYLRSRPLEEDKPVFLQMVKKGLSDSEIAAHFGATKHLIWQRRKDWNLPQSQSAQQNKIKDDLITLWKEGYLPKEIASHLGLALSTVYAKMRQMAIRKIPRMGFKSDRTLSLHELTQANKNLSDEEVILVTRNRVPRWVLVPVDQYQDLVTGVFDDIRS